MMLINPFMVSPSIAASTRILMPFTTTSGFVDVAGGHAITVVGTPTIATLAGVFDDGALLVSPTSYIKVDSTPTLSLGAKAPFTVEFDVYITIGTYPAGILSMRDSNVYVPFIINRDGSLIGNDTLDAFSGIAASIPLNTKTRVKLVGDGTNITEYINGVAAAISRTHSNWSSIDRFLTIGHDFSGSMTGYISNFRFSNVAL
jgi:hypothetical protein